MKRNKFIQFLLIIGSILLLQGCQENTNKHTTIPTTSQEQILQIEETDKPSPKLEFEQTTIEWGEIGIGTTSEGQFKFTNTGEGVLEIQKIEGCCGITTTFEKNKYEPGESGVIKVIFRETSGQVGQANREFKVISNDKENPEFVLSTKAKVVARIACKPELIKLFIDEENAACPDLTINSLDEKTFSITNLISTSNCITADLDPSISAMEFTLDLKADPEKLADNRTGSIEITLTHPEADTLTVPFSVIPKYTVTPQNFLLYNAQEQVPERKTISITNRLTDDFEIESITSDNNTLEVISQNKEENIYKIEVDITPPAKNGNIRFIDTITIQIKDGPQFEISCSGFYQ